MKPILTFVFAILLSHSSLAQQASQRTISAFSRVEVSEGIDLVLEQGSSPALKLTYSGVEPEAIITEVSGKKLKIYLKGCHRGCKESVQRAYRSTKVIAYLTYTTLEKLVVMGDNEIINKSPIRANRFVLRSYGDNAITLRDVQADYWKAALYGDSNLSVENGRVSTLKIKAYGDNTINTQLVDSRTSKIHALGDNSVQVTAQEKLNVTVLGDAIVQYKGQPGVATLVLGELSLHEF